MFVDISIDYKVLFKNELTSDVKFVLNDRNGIEQIIPAHKAILMSYSPVFEKMFYGSLKEGDSVPLTDVSAEAFTEFLQFFYINKFELTIDSLPEVFKLIDKYEALTFWPFCEEFMKNTISPNVAFVYYELALFYKLSKGVVDTLEDVIFEDPQKTLEYAIKDGSSKMVLEQLLKSERLYCQEIDIFRNVIAWATASLANKDMDISADNIKYEIGNCLKYLRFPVMKVHEFLECIEKYQNLLPPDQYLDILCYITTKRELTFARHFSTLERRIERFLTVELFIDYLKFTFTMPENKNRKYKIKFSQLSVPITVFIYAKNNQAIYSEEFKPVSLCYSLSSAISFKPDTTYEIYFVWNLVPASRSIHKIENVPFPEKYPYRFPKDEQSPLSRIIVLEFEEVFD